MTRGERMDTIYTKETVLKQADRIAEYIKRDMAQKAEIERLKKPLPTLEELLKVIGEWYILHLGNTGATEHNAKVLATAILDLLKGER